MREHGSEDDLTALLEPYLLPSPRDAKHNPHQPLRSAEVTSPDAESSLLRDWKTGSNLKANPDWIITGVSTASPGTSTGVLKL